MKEKEKNIALKVARLACRNLAAELAWVNGMKTAAGIHILVKGKDRLLQATWDVMHGVAAKDRYDVVRRSVQVRTAKPLAHSVDAARVFLQSVEFSSDARVCQRRLLDVWPAARLLQAAYEFDSVREGSRAVESARRTVQSVCGARFLENFTFVGRPDVDPRLRDDLIRRAFDSRFAFTSQATIRSMAESRYQQIYLSGKPFFASSDPGDGETVQVPPVMDLAVRPGGMNINLLYALYRGESVRQPLSGVVRYMVNLPMCCQDICAMPLRLLETKRKHLLIDVRSRRSYILSHYDDLFKGKMDGNALSLHYTQKEAEMYQAIWNTDGALMAGAEAVILPDGMSIAVPKGEQVHMFLHEINTIYAALFGCDPAADQKGGKRWLEDAIRKAYTDEGMADYRAAVATARLEGRM